MAAKYLVCGALLILLAQVSLSKDENPKDCKQRFIALSYAFGNYSAAYGNIRKLSEDKIKICDNFQNFTSCIGYAGLEVVFKVEELFKSNVKLTQDIAHKTAPVMQCVSMPELELSETQRFDDLLDQFEALEQNDCRSAFVQMRDSFGAYSEAYRGVQAILDRTVNLCDKFDSFLGCIRLIGQDVVYKLKDALQSSDRHTRKMMDSVTQTVRCVKIPVIYKLNRSVAY